MASVACVCVYAFLFECMLCPLCTIVTVIIIGQSSAAPLHTVLSLKSIITMCYVSVDRETRAVSSACAASVTRVYSTMNTQPYTHTYFTHREKTQDEHQ